jgi:SanA protein
MSFRFWRNIIITLVFALLLVVGVMNHLVNASTQTQIYTDITKLPKNKVGLLLGTAKYMDKARKIINMYYQNRIDAAVALYMAGKVDYIIVSGDNGTTYYNEPALMKADLIARGVPASRIFMDNAGFRTLDSILRCRDIFGQNQFTVISQQFHNQRALYIANHKEVNAIGFNAADGDMYWEVALREKLARVKMGLDLMFNKQAKTMGATIDIK